MRMKRYRSGSISVDVDISEIIDELEDEWLIEEVKNRNLESQLLPASVSQTPFVRDYLELAHEALMAGRSSEALALLDRALFPTSAERGADGQMIFKAAP